MRQHAAQRRPVRRVDLRLQRRRKIDRQRVMPLFLRKAARRLRVAVGIRQIGLDIVNPRRRRRAPAPPGCAASLPQASRTTARWDWGETATAWRTRPCARCRPASAGAPSATTHPARRRKSPRSATDAKSPRRRAARPGFDRAFRTRFPRAFPAQRRSGGECRISAESRCGFGR